MSRICCSSAGPTSVTKRCGTGEINFARCLQRTFAASGFPECAASDSGLGVSTRCICGINAEMRYLRQTLVTNARVLSKQYDYSSKPVT